MELRRLRYFVAVAEELHFGRAARKINVVQSAISHQVRLLEGELGFALFERTRQKVTLTALGEIFLREAVAILLRARQGVERARASAAGKVGSLTIGFVDNALWGVLPSILRNFRVKYPSIDLKLLQMDRVAQIEALQSSSIDIAIMPAPAPAPSAGEIDTFLLMSAPLLAVMPKDHHLAGRARVALRDLASEPFVLFPARMRSRMREIIIDACSAAGFEPRVSQEAEQLHTLIVLVRAGLGVTIVPKWVTQTHNIALSHAVLSDSLPPYELIVARQSGNTNPAVERFCATENIRSATAFQDFSSWPVFSAVAL
jgi:DNA-binding transcriptional LysR family regulator